MHIHCIRALLFGCVYICMPPVGWHRRWKKAACFPMKSMAPLIPNGTALLPKRLQWAFVSWGIRGKNPVRSTPIHNKPLSPYRRVSQGFNRTQRWNRANSKPHSTGVCSDSERGPVLSCGTTTCWGPRGCVRYRKVVMTLSFAMRLACTKSSLILWQFSLGDRHEAFRFSILLQFGIPIHLEHHQTKKPITNCERHCCI